MKRTFAPFTFLARMFFPANFRGVGIDPDRKTFRVHVCQLHGTDTVSQSFRVNIACQKFATCPIQDVSS